MASSIQNYIYQEDTIYKYQIGNYNCTSIQRRFETHTATPLHKPHSFDEIWKCYQGIGRLYIGEHAELMVPNKTVIVPSEAPHMFISDTDTRIEITNFNLSNWTDRRDRLLNDDLSIIEIFNALGREEILEVSRALWTKILAKQNDLFWGEIVEIFKNGSLEVRYAVLSFTVYAISSVKCRLSISDSETYFKLFEYGMQCDDIILNKYSFFGLSILLQAQPDISDRFYNSRIPFLKPEATILCLAHYGKNRKTVAQQLISLLELKNTIETTDIELSEICQLVVSLLNNEKLNLFESIKLELLSLFETFLSIYLSFRKKVRDILN